MKTLTKNIIGNRRRAIALEEKALFTGAEIYNRKGRWNILVEDGFITKLSDKNIAASDAANYDLSGKTVITGAVDLHTVIREPGREDVETLETAALAAANGGFVQVCMMPSTTPPLDSAEIVQFVQKTTDRFLTKINVIGALTKGREGKSIAAFAELAEEGAIAFSDGRSHVSSTALMHTALTYVKMLDKPIIVKPADAELNDKGQMHEGFESTRLGFHGMPSIAEEIVVSRDLHIAEYVEGRIHFTNISTKGSVELIRAAKARGVKVTCDVAVHNLLHTDSEMQSFNTNFKLDPPLRTQDHIDALIAGLIDGTIDAISSTHLPHSWEEKEAEFIYAPFGAVSLETMLPLLLDRFVKTGIFSLEKMVEFVSSRPAQIFKLEEPKLEENAPAAFTVLDLNEEHTINKNLFLSKANNSPYDGFKLKGNVIATIANGQKYFK